MATKLFIWVGHPRDDSFSHALADAYQCGPELKARTDRADKIGVDAGRQ